MSASSKRYLATSVITAAAVAATVVAGTAQQKDRSAVPDQYKWDLTQIYPSDQAWRAAKDKLVGELPAVRTFRGTLGSSAPKLTDALELTSRLSKEFTRLYVFASMMSDQDTRVSSYQGMQQEMAQVGATFGAETSFMEPEILKLDASKVESFIASEPRLKVYNFYLHDILRRREHTLSDNEEKMLASSSVMASASSDSFGILSDADFPYPTVTLSDGKSAKLDSAGFSLYRAVPNRADREKVMSAFFGALGAFRATFGSTLNGQVQSDVFFAKARNYKSALERSLDAANIPTTVYTRLVDGVNRGLPTFHRYLNLRKRMMGVSELHYYDLYAPLVSSVDSDVHRRRGGETRAGGAQTARHRLCRRGQPRVQRTLDRPVSQSRQTIGRLFEWRRLRRSPVHADQLQRQVQRRQHDRSRARAHDAAYLSNKTQPYPLADYPIFVAEVASTLQRGAAHRSHVQDDQRRRRPSCRCSGTISRASRAPCSGRRSSPSSSCARTRWPKRESR